MAYRKTSASCKILDKKLVYTENAAIGDVFLLRLEWHGDSYPGCFFQLQPDNEYLRRPISLCGSGEGFIDLAIRVAGEGTRDLVSREVGDEIECFGPLGRGFELPHEIDKEARYLVIGGGIGVAPLLPLVSALDSENREQVDFVIGFRGEPYFASYATHVCTENKEIALDDLIRDAQDSACRRRAQPHHGIVLPVVEELLKTHKHGTERAYDDIFICGPKKMLDALALLCIAHGYDPQLLTEAHMGCGVGACLVCTTEVHAPHQYARVCADGPMFRASELKLEGGCRNGADDSRLTNIRPVVDVIRSGAEVSQTSLSKETANQAAGSCDNAGKCHAASGGDCDISGACCDPLAVELGRFKLKSLLTMASGTFGFGREYDAFFDIGILGGVSVKGLTLAQKAGNPGRRVVEITGGMINSVGLQNPGVEHFIAHEAAFLRGKNVAVIANINGESISDMVEMARTVDAHVDAVELNISCPNVSAGGMSFGTDPKMTAEIVRAVRAVTASPLIVKLTPNVTNIVDIAKVCEAEGAEILSMINTVTGLAVDWRTGEKPLRRGFGGMSGATVKPVALRCIDAVASCVRIPIIGMGGISCAQDVIEFLRVGAHAVAIGTAIFRDPLLPLKIDSDLRQILKNQGKSKIAQFYR
ncbi:MAG: dihydroorotate dehydrogenase [Bacillota bacterium]|nr:dihydroorotate dehydrogenase [Bacillota bacterium]